ncbi:hypothetical protein GGH99_003123 [Coemansia sp. RSA 1285]|nr:hypothetical protein GGH99_003123 [Coemansia sp. RSA 1285]
MKRLQSENRSLWMQASAAEERYKRHQATIDKILRFLATVFSPDNQHGEIHPPLRRLISHVSQGKNNVQEAATQGKSTHTGASTPEKRAMPPVSPSPIETLQGGSRSGIYETADSVGAQQPPDKRMRREQPSSSSRITEMPSASPPVYSSKRKVSNPMSTALTRTHLMRPLNELILTGAGSGADANALVTSPNNTYGGLRAQSKSIEQLQSEIDYLGHSLENLTRHLQYGGGQPSIPIAPNNLSAAAAALSGLQSSHNPLADSVQQMQHQQMYQHQQQQQQQQQTAVPTSTTTGAQNIDLASILSGDTLNNLAMALSSADTSQMTLPVSSSSMGNPGILDDASMASLGLTGNPPTVTPQVAEKGVGDNLDPAVLMDMLKTVTPEQYDYLQNYFRLISGSNTSIPLLTASNGTAATQSPDVLLNETPFLDFVDPTAADAPISSSSAASGTAAAADYVHRTNNYAQIILDALNSSAGEATDPLLAASILGTSSSAQPSMSVGAPVEPKSSNTSTPAQQNNQ